MSATLTTQTPDHLRNASNTPASLELSDRSKMMYYRAVLRKIAGNDPETNRQSADSLAMNALDRFGDL